MEDSKLLSFNKFKSLLPEGIHRTTFHYWIHHGCQSTRGKTVRLQAIKIGGRWYCCKTWLDNFVKALFPDQLPSEVKIVPNLEFIGM